MKINGKVATLLAGAVIVAGGVGFAAPASASVRTYYLQNQAGGKLDMAEVGLNEPEYLTDTANNKPQLFTSTDCTTIFVVSTCRQQLMPESMNRCLTYDINTGVIEVETCSTVTTAVNQQFWTGNNNLVNEYDDGCAYVGGGVPGGIVEGDGTCSGAANDTWLQN
jgi:hypothetical protein